MMDDLDRSIAAAADVICNRTRDSLRDLCNDILDRLTEDEITEFSTDGAGRFNPNRLIKIILLAFSADLIDNDWNAEAIKPYIPKIKRIVRRR